MLDLVVVLEMDGANLLAALNNGVCKYPALEGRFLQVSFCTNVPVYDHAPDLVNHMCAGAGFRGQFCLRGTHGRRWRACSKQGVLTSKASHSHTHISPSHRACWRPVANTSSSYQVVASSVKIGGEPLELTKLYKVCTTMACAGRDGVYKVCLRAIKIDRIFG